MLLKSKTKMFLPQNRNRSPPRKNQNQQHNNLSPPRKNQNQQHNNLSPSQQLRNLIRPLQNRHKSQLRKNRQPKNHLPMKPTVKTAVRMGKVTKPRPIHRMSKVPPVKRLLPQPMALETRPSAS